MLDEQGNFNLNLGEYLQRAKVLAALDPEMPHAIADSVVGPDGPNMIGGNAPREIPMGDSVVPRPSMPDRMPEMEQDQFQPQSLPETRNYMDTVRKEPLKEQYHPSKTRNVLSKIAGIGVGMFNPALGEYVNDKISNAPFNRQMEEFGQREQRDKVLMDTERGMYKDLSTENLQGAQAEHQLALSGKESTPEVLRAKLTDGREVNVKINPQGRYIDTDTGAILASNVIESVNKVGTPQRQGEDNSPLGHFIRAQKLLDSPDTPPEIKKGAQVTVDNFLTKKRVDLNLNATTKLWAEETIAKYDTDPTSVPEHEYKAAQSIVKGESTADNKPKVQTFQDASGNVTATVVPTAEDLTKTGGYKKLGNFGRPSPPPGSFTPLVNATGQITDFFNPKSGQNVKPPSDGNRKAPLSSAELDRRSTLNSMLRATGIIETLGPKYQDRFGKIQGNWEKLKGEIIGNDEDVVTLIQNAEDLKDMLLRARSGAQINEQEYGRLAKLMPTIDVPFTTFKARLKSFKDELATMMNTRATGELGVGGGSNQGKKGDPLGIL